MADSTKPGDEKTRLYHPYQDLQVPIRNLYNLPTSPEHLFPEEAARRHRSWGENLQYYTGCGYLSGAILGAGKGTLEGLKAAEPGDTLKLRINRVLNSGGQTGRRFGNSLGVLGLIFAGLESGIIHWRGTDDLLNSVVAGLGTGALYRAAAGPRSAAIAGAIGGIAAAAAVAGKQAVKRYVPI
ncbi:Mitochondrial import inner membrane translocase subunit TIM23-like protein [Quillaja saponaria]|uniref:Mitochondrial import inner membrane translocase subunit TIM23-like protein n=1 Tax=Quillaja saponaria TaxID=32244 RepID=A0AAD7VF73_QUISA|nr:Mitochondrial import inner membrane translocase subunit TIM23-like protein [Quillaja saponaria]